MAETKIKAAQFHGVVGHGTDGYFLMTNADGSMSWAEGGTSGPSVTSVDYPGDDTAADPAGNQTVVLTGTNFGSSMSVTIGGTTAPSVAHDSSTQLTITTPAKAAGDYDIVVTNTVTGTSGTFVNGISYNGIPTWTTAAGSLGTFESETTISTITLAATEPDGGTITFNITNGALPTGLSLTGANIDGTTTAESSTTLYSFTIEAIDDENQSTPRNFSITVNSAEIVPSQNFTINTYTGNGSTQSIEGKIGTAASFDGSSNISIGSVGMGVNDFTYSFWFNTNNITTANANIISPSADHGSYGLQLTTSGLSVYPDTGDYLISSTGIISANTWYHVAYVKSSTAGHTLYLNGSSIATDANFTGNYNAATGSVTKFGSATNDIQWFSGKLDQVRFFNKALSSSEVTTLYNEPSNLSTASTTDIFDDGSGVALYEFEKGAIDTGGVNGYIGSAGVFNGSSSYILLNGINGTNFTPTAYSVSAWFKTTSNNEAIFSTDGGGSSLPLTTMTRIFVNSGGYIEYDPYTVSSRITSTVTVNDGNWHFVCVSTDSSGNTKLYVDNQSPVTGTGGGVNFRAQTFIGCTDNAVYSTITRSNFFEGQIDQVRIFNKALSSSEVTTLSNETSASATKSTTDIFDDGSGVALYELEGNANDTGLGAIDSGQSGDFDGSNYLTTPYTIGTTFSVSSWFKTTATGEVSIIGNGGGSGSQRGFQISVVSGSLKIYFSEGGTASYTSSNTHNDGLWHNVVLTDNNGTFNTYVDGVLDSNLSGTTTYYTSTTATQSTTIGRFAPSANYFFNGQIDDVRIYSSVLTSTQAGYIADNDTGNIPTAQALYKLDGNSNDSAGSNNAAWNGTATYSDPAEFPAYNGTATNVTYAYDGTPTNVGFVGTSFQPDLVWIKRRSNIEDNAVFDSVRGVQNQITTNKTNAESTKTNALSSFDSNGFTTGANNALNTNNETYVAWCWKAGGGAGTYNIDGTGHATLGAAGLSITGVNGNSPTFTGCSINTEAGFGIYEIDPNFTASSHRADFTHGLNSTPQLIFVKVVDGTGGNWWAFTNAIDGSWDRGKLHTTDSFQDDTLTGADVATSTLIRVEDAFISTASRVLFYAFASVDGYQRIGSYTGNDSSKRIYTDSNGNGTGTGAFAPRFLLIKCSSNGGTNKDWNIFDTTRDPSPINQRLEANTADNEFTDTSNITINSDGFTLGDNGSATGSINQIGFDYIYLAIA